MPNSKPHVHKRSSSGEAACGRGGAHPRLTAYTDEVTCTYCAMGVTGVSGHSVHPLPASVLTARWTTLRAEITSFRDAHSDRANNLTDEGKDGAPEAFARADELRKVIALMDRMEADR